MQLVITLRKEVANPKAGLAILNMVIEKLASYPDVKIAGHVTNHFDLTPPSEPPE